MNLNETLKALEVAGTAQNRKVYARHGVHREMYGVSFANLKAMAKRLKGDHALAVGLWNSGNHDACILATMIADPTAIKASELEAWVKELDSYVLTDAFAMMAAKTPHARAKGEKWSRAKGEWVGAAGWNVLTQLAMADPETPDAYFQEKLAVIEKTIHQAKNRTRYSMNNTLIAIGVRSRKLETEAVAAAKRIGKVEVDHGETGCKTPDAAPYIRKAAAHHRAKAARAKLKTATRKVTRAKKAEEE